jgi:hypothetical protein
VLGSVTAVVLVALFVAAVLVLAILPSLGRAIGIEADLVPLGPARGLAARRWCPRDTGLVASPRHR